MWSIPRMWEGRTVAVLCSGESMNQRAADAVRVAGIPAIAINTTFRLIPEAAMLYAADWQWWQATPEALKFAGLKVTCTEPRKGVHQLRNAGTVGYDDDASCIHAFGNSGTQAIQIAAKAGAKRILVLGMDMGGGHWHTDHPAPLEQTLGQTYERWIDRMDVLAKELARRGVDVVNCSPVSRLRCFRKSSLEAELASCAEPSEA